jgi:hypothetical protein
MEMQLNSHKRLKSYCWIMLFLISFLFSCSNSQEEIQNQEMQHYKHYKKDGTSELKFTESIKYSHSSPNDSLILIKIYSAEKSGILERQLFLNLRIYSKADMDEFKNDSDWNEYYSYKSHKIYLINNQPFEIYTFTSDSEEMDSGFRIYFNKQEGYLAGYSTSWYFLELFKGNGERKDSLIDALLVDSIFFPKPK